MARSIDSLLVSHEAAQERRDAGKPIWDRRLTIKHLLSSDSSDEQAATTARTIGSVLKGSTWCTADRKRAEQNGEDSEILALAQKLSRARTLRRLNTLLDELYDLADADRVWIA